MTHNPAEIFVKRPSVRGNGWDSYWWVVTTDGLYCRNKDGWQFSALGAWCSKAEAERRLTLALAEWEEYTETLRAAEV